MSEESFWLGIWFMVLTAVVLVVLILTVGSCCTRRIMAEGGYEQVSEPVEFGTFWKKIER